MSISDEQAAVIEAARRIHYDLLDMELGLAMAEAHCLGYLSLEERLSHVGDGLDALRQTLTMLKAAETREAVVGAKA